MTFGSQFAQYINPLLAALRSLGGSAKAEEARAAVAVAVGDAVVEERLASGQSRFDNQVGWARYYLVRAGYIDSSKCIALRHDRYHTPNSIGSDP